MDDTHGSVGIPVPATPKRRVARRISSPRSPVGGATELRRLAGDRLLDYEKWFLPSMNDLDECQMILIKISKKPA